MATDGGSSSNGAELGSSSSQTKNLNSDGNIIKGPGGDAVAIALSQQRMLSLDVAYNRAVRAANLLTWSSVSPYPDLGNYSLARSDEVEHHLNFVPRLFEFSHFTPKLTIFIG